MYSSLDANPPLEKEGRELSFPFLIFDDLWVEIPQVFPGISQEEKNYFPISVNSGDFFDKYSTWV